MGCWGVRCLGSKLSIPQNCDDRLAGLLSVTRLKYSKGTVRPPLLTSGLKSSNFCECPATGGALAILART
jgi:hypothetical protein